jgi:WD40 repeat protein
LSYPGYGVSAFAWAPANKPNTIAIGNGDGNISIWDTSSPQQKVLEYSGHNYSITSIAWSLDSRYIASIDKYGYLYIWDSSHGNDMLQALPVEYKYSTVRNVAWWGTAAQPYLVVVFDDITNLKLVVFRVDWSFGLARYR